MVSCDAKTVNVNEANCEVGPSKSLNRKPQEYIPDKVIGTRPDRATSVKL